MASERERASTRPRSLAVKSQKCYSPSLARVRITKSATRARSLAEIFRFFRTLLAIMVNGQLR